MLVKRIAMGIRQWLFFAMFSMSALKESWHLLTIGNDWMIEQMIIHIKKTITKALDTSNKIIKCFFGMSTR
jgi:hypothetical protein